MRRALTMLLAIAVPVITTVLVFTAFGLGKAFSLVLPLSVFEASLLSLLALLPPLYAAWRLFAFGMRYGLAHADDEQEDDGDELDDEYDDAAYERDRKVVAASLQHVGVHVGRNAPCPCGSGKKCERFCGMSIRSSIQAVQR